MIVLLCRPLNFLINPKHRWIYIFMFPTMATSMYEGFSFIVAGKLDANIFSHLFWKLRKLWSEYNLIFYYYNNI